MHQKDKLLEAELKTKQVGHGQTARLLNLPTHTMQKEKEDLEEISNELELADEDEKVK